MYLAATNTEDNKWLALNFNQSITSLHQKATEMIVAITRLLLQHGNVGLPLQVLKEHNHVMCFIGQPYSPFLHHSH